MTFRIQARQNLHPDMANVSKKGPRRNFDIKPDGWTYPVWMITSILLIVGPT